MTRPRNPTSAALVRLVTAREISARVKDKNFIISSIFIIVLLVGMLGLQVGLNSGGEATRLGVVGGDAALEEALGAQAFGMGVELALVELDDEDAARTAIEDDEIDGALLTDEQGARLLVEQSAGGSMQAVVQGAVAQTAVSERLAQAGIAAVDVPDVEVTALDPDADQDEQRTAVALIGVAVLYSLLILFGQFVAQGVVEEKASRVVELLLATMRPWQLLAGKIIGLGILGLAQIVVIAAIGVGGALAFDLVDIPGELIGTAASVVAWFVLGYAFYAAIFAVTASLVSRQEDLNSVVMPTMLVLVAAVIVGIQAAAAPDGTLAVVTSYVPGLSPLVMPVRQAAGDVGLWEVAPAVALMLVATALIVRLGGRVYAGALLRTSGKTTIRDALRAQRA
ncbi:MAG TPA: ABC transporter permease [Blastococcus sp.]|jgi:ABC-2 type transport system permease protein